MSHTSKTYVDFLPWGISPFSIKKNFLWPCDFSILVPLFLTFSILLIPTFVHCRTSLGTCDSELFLLSNKLHGLPVGGLLWFLGLCCGWVCFVHGCVELFQGLECGYAVLWWYFHRLFAVIWSDPVGYWLFTGGLSSSFGYKGGAMRLW